MSPKHQIRQKLLDDILELLVVFKTSHDVSWDDMALMCVISKRTILRWRKTKRMNAAYYRLLKSDIIPNLDERYIKLGSLKAAAREQVELTECTE